jgi:hypothetical protein
MTRRRKPIEQRFWEKVAIPNDPDNCWEWIGAIDPDTGYGRIGLGGRSDGVTSAHRLSYEMHYGPLASGMDACHSCNNRVCINPRHLYEGTRGDNMQQAKRDGRLKRQYKPWSPERRAAFLLKKRAA